MHTIGNKVTGLLVFVALSACVLLGLIPAYVSIPVCTAALLSATEESAILLTAHTYDPNRRTLFEHKKTTA